MGFSSVVQWWEQEQLRALVLGSLAVQYFLFFFAGRRKSRIPSWYRFFIWLSYLASDALAIYALATLFNRQKKMQYRSSDLQVMWAPILLMHLGGQLVITAYNIEDNELWKRHIITSSSQVTVAIYVFCKSWPSSADKKLLAAAICLFTIGAAKCFQKPLALMKASFSSLDRFLDDHSVGITDGENDLEYFVRNAKAYMVQKDPETPNDDIQIIFHTLLLDYACSCYTRLAAVRRFCHLDDEKAYATLTYGLSNFFDLLYTREPYTKDMNGWSSFLMWLFSVASPIATIVLFHKSRKQAYNISDVNVTFVLLYGTLLLEIISIYGLFKLDGKWSPTVAQHNLIGFFAQTKKPSKLMRFARSLSREVFVSQFLSMDSCDSTKDITKLVHQHIKDGWEKYVTDAKSYKEFNGMRGQWTLQHKGCDQQLGCSLEQPFDQSVLTWHLATDLCFYCRSTSSEHEERAQRCREISNYMMHLLFANPEMLLPGSRKHLFKVAYDEFNEMFKGEEAQLDEGKLAQKVVDTLTSGEDIKPSFTDQAVWLYTWLIDMDENKMWEVIQGVWVEMLCFSAGRCRGYLHAKSIGAGGEYLSYIWLLLHNTGMETFQHKLERPQYVWFSEKEKKKKKLLPLGNQENATTPSTYQGMNPSTEGGTSADLWPPQSEGSYTYQGMDAPTQGENFASQYSEGVATYQGMNLPMQGGTIAAPWSPQVEGASGYPGMAHGGIFAGPWPSQYGAGAYNYPGMNPPTQGGNFAAPWDSQYCQGTSTYQGMNVPTEGSNAAGPCFQM